MRRSRKLLRGCRQLFCGGNDFLNQVVNGNTHIPYRGFHTPEFIITGYRADKTARAEVTMRELLADADNQLQRIGNLLGDIGNEDRQDNDNRHTGNGHVANSG